MPALPAPLGALLINFNKNILHNTDYKCYFCAVLNICFVMNKEMIAKILKLISYVCTAVAGWLTSSLGVI